jgi:hypothetical protein
LNHLHGNPTTLAKNYDTDAPSPLQTLGDVLNGAAAVGTAEVPGGEGIPATILSGAKAGIHIGTEVGAGSAAEHSSGSPVPTEEDLASVAGGAVSGAAGGAVLGAGTGILSKFISSLPERKAQAVIDLVSPKATPVKGAKALAGGMGEAPGVFTKGKIDYSMNPSIVRAANAVQDIVKPGKSYIDNTNRVYNAISDLSENTIKPFLSANPAPFNFADLRKSMELTTPRDTLKANPTAFKTYNSVRESLLNDVEGYLKQSGNTSNSTDFNELWNARKVVDNRIQAELGDKTFGTPQYAGVKAAARDFRNGLNQFMFNSLANPGKMEDVNKYADFLKTARSRGISIPNESDAMQALQHEFGVNQDQEASAKAAFFKDSLDKLNSMYEAVGNMAPKAYKEVGKTSYQLWLKNHPLLAKVGGGAAAALGAGALFKGGSDLAASLGE